jgi:hypothetical protein
MQPRIIDGERWIAQRVKFLQGLLHTEISPEQRCAVEAEIDSLSKERGIRQGGRRRIWTPRRWWGRRPKHTKPPS